MEWVHKQNAASPDVQKWIDKTAELHWLLKDKWDPAN